MSRHGDQHVDDADGEADDFSAFAWLASLDAHAGEAAVRLTATDDDDTDETLFSGCWSPLHD